MKIKVKFHWMAVFFEKMNSQMFWLSSQEPKKLFERSIVIFICFQNNDDDPVFYI